MTTDDADSHEMRSSTDRRRRATSFAITIRRAGGEPIPYAEWVREARADGDIVPTPADFGSHPPNGPADAVFAWRSRPGENDDEPTTFIYVRGRIVVDHTHEAWIPRILALAERLGAQAVGDDGEPCRLETPPSAPSEAVRPSWWQRMLGR